MRIPQILAALLLVMLTSIGALSQDQRDGTDFAVWNSIADRAEAAIEAGRASDRALEDLRAEIVIWRERFLQDLDSNAARIRTLEAQIEALGSPPAEGESEAAGIAVQRADLVERLETARAPVRTADVAFTQANGLIGEIDAIVRDRRAGALLRRDPSPLNPVYWGTAFSDLTGSLRSVRTEIVEIWGSAARFRQFVDGLPRILLLLALSAVLLFRGRRLLRSVLQRFYGQSIERAPRFLNFMQSVGELAVSLLGLMLLVWAIVASGLLGARGDLIANALPYIGFCALGAHWLACRFSPDTADETTSDDDARWGARIRQSAVWLGLMAGFSAMLGSLAEYDGYSAASTAVLLFPLAAAAAAGLLFIGRAVLSFVTHSEDEHSDSQSALWLGVLGRTLAVLAAVGGLLAAAGYLNASLYLLVATGMSLALLALLYLLNGILHELYGLVMDVDESAAQAALTPTLLGLAMALASLPLFALIWGARTSDLTELWANVREGVTLGDVRIAPENALSFIIVFIVLYLATRIVQATLRSNVLPKTKIEPGGQAAIVSGVGYVGIFLAALLATVAAGINLSSVAFVAGALSIGIGFGLQNIVGNFVSGIILLIERPVSEGDWIQVGEHVGTVKKVSVRSTLIETFDRTDVIVPNGDFISGTVTNWTRGNKVGRIKVLVGVAYGTDTRRVAKILYEIASEHPVVTKDPEPGVDFLGFGADSLEFRIRAVLTDVNQSVVVLTELNHRIAERFAEEGIEIPFGQRDIWLRNPETLTGASPIPKAAPNKRKAPSRQKSAPEVDPEVTDKDIDGAEESA